MKEFNFDFIGKRKIFYILSSSLILLSILISIFFGVKVDIKFSGGAMLTYSYTNELKTNDVAKTVKDTIAKDAEVRSSTDIATGKQNVIISLAGKEGLTVDQQQKLTSALKSTYKDNNIELTSTTNVDAAMGNEFFLKCLVAVGFSALLMLIYIAFRFKRISGWSAGMMAVVALLHDVAMVYATFVIFRIPLNDNFMAVVLTILGYSINDTIVIYDRVRENKKIYANSLGTVELMNKSINQTLSRTINTSVTTILAMIVVLIVAFVCGIDSIFTFAFPIIIGMLSGVYSTVCISSTLWVDWQLHKEKRAKAKKSGSKKAAKA